MNLKALSKTKKVLFGGFFVLLLVGIGLTLYQVQRQQDLRQRASGTNELISQVQEVLHASTTMASRTQFRFGSPVTQGNLIVVAVAARGNEADISSIVDSRGNTYTRAVIKSINVTADAGKVPTQVAIFYANNITGGDLLFTIDTPKPMKITASAYEFKGVHTRDPIASTSSDAQTTYASYPGLSAVPSYARIIGAITHQEATLAGIDPALMEDEPLIAELYDMSINSLDSTPLGINNYSVGDRAGNYTSNFYWDRAVNWKAVQVVLKPAITLNAGEKLIPCGVRGDVNSDGRISVADADMMKAEKIGKKDWTADELSRGDLNNDGIINETGDYLLIGQYIGGSITTFPVACSGPTHTGLMFDNGQKKIFTITYNPGQNMETTTCTIIREQVCSALPQVTLYQGLNEGCVRTGGYGGAEELWKEIKCPTPPVAITSPAKHINSTFATLQGSVDPKGVDTTVGFVYSDQNIECKDMTLKTEEQIIYGSEGLTTHTKNTPSSQALIPGRTYYYCATAKNVYQTVYGDKLSFTTLDPGLFVVNMTTPSNITQTGAHLSAGVESAGVKTRGRFRYGTQNVGCSELPLTSTYATTPGTPGFAYERDITGLQPGTTYRACVEYQAVSAEGNAGEPVLYSNVISFKTLANTGAPTVTTIEASDVTVDQATLNSIVNPNGLATTVFYKYSGAGGACNTFNNTSVTQSISGSQAIRPNAQRVGMGQGWYYCAVATNSVGTTYGAVLQLPVLGATIVSDGATEITQTTAKLGFSGNSNGKTTSITIRYQEGQGNNCTSTLPSLTIAGPTNLSGVFVSYVPLSGLKANTLYTYCATATNTDGTTYGGLKTFTTTGTTQLTCDPSGDNAISNTDFEIWKDEFLGVKTSNTSGCFKPDGKVDLLDFQVWKDIVLGVRQPF